MEIEQWIGTSCHPLCEILDAQGLWAARAKLGTPPVQDVEWANPNNKLDLPPMEPVEDSTCIGRNLISQQELISNPHIVPSSVPFYPVYTAAEQDLGILDQPVVAEYGRSSYGGLINIPKYGISGPK